MRSSTETKYFATEITKKINLNARDKTVAGLKKQNLPHLKWSYVGEIWTDKLQGLDLIIPILL